MKYDDRKTKNPLSKRVLSLTFLFFIFSGQSSAIRTPNFVSPQERINYFTYIGEVLHIVKEYYVDRASLKNISILQHVAKEINEATKTVEFKKLSPTKYELKIRNNKMTVTDTMTDTDLIASLQLLAFEYGLSKGVSHPKEAYEFTLRSLLNHLDPHTLLLSMADYDELIEGTEGLFGGLGIIVTLEQDHVLSVIKVLPNSPALKAGIKQHDKIIGIEGRVTFGNSLNELVTKMKGKPGSSINLTLLSKGARSPHKVRIERDIILVNSVEANLLEKKNGKYLHLKIKNFASRTATEIADQIKKHNKKKSPLSGIILDMRGNPGGLLGQAIEVSDLFLSKGTIVQTKGISNEIALATPKNDICKQCSMVTLIGAESASASEIVSSALQDNKRSLTIGKNSFGKSTVQTLFELQTREAIKLTIARYYRSKGVSLQNIGVSPDLSVQEVYPEKLNENLMGIFRYNREKFLSYQKPSTFLQTSNEMIFSPYHLYYIPQKDKEQDFLLNLAEGLLIASKKAWKAPKKGESVLINKKLVFEKSEKIKKLIASENKKVTSSLKKNYKINWSSNYAFKNKAKSLDLLLGKAPSTQLSPGDSFTIPFKAKSKTKEKSERISLFVRDPSLGFSIYEQLIGSVSQKQASSGKIKLRAPFVEETRDYSLEIGLAIDGVAQLETIKTLQIKVQKSPEIRLVTNVKLSGEKGGKIAGKLEAKEKAFLSIEVENQSNHPSKEISLQVFNLSGEQIKVDDSEIKIESLKGKEKRTLNVAIQGNQKIQQKELNLGLSLKSYSTDPIRNPFVIQGVP